MTMTTYPLRLPYLVKLVESFISICNMEANEKHGFVRFWFNLTSDHIAAIEAYFGEVHS